MDGGFFAGDDGRARFGWVHRPANPNGVGLVIVPPFGYEAICSHRSLRHLADAAAAAGIVAVRFDLDGTGDSAGDDLERGRLDAWLASISDACDLARSAGADRIVLAGVRLGASLATLAAAKRGTASAGGDVVGVVAIAAVPSGKALVREGRALQMALGLAEPPAGTAIDPELHEQVGFALTGETRTALSQIDLLKAQRPPAPAMLVIDRDDLPPNDKWIAALQALGVAVEHARLPGYVEMMLDPHRAEVPRAIVAATVAFAAARLPVPAPPPARVVELSPRARISGVDEELVRIDGLAAIATRGLGASGGFARIERAVILLNAGAVYRIGPNRLYVELARKLAWRGTLTIRVDLSGLGDSKARDDHENVVYNDHAVSDVGAVVAWARRQGAAHVSVVGLCSGAYYAQKSALAHPIDTIVPINPLTFFWKPGMPLDFAAFKVVEDTERYKQSMKSAASWQKLLRGKVDVRRVARVVAERAKSVAEHRGRDMLRRLRVPLPDDLGTELHALARKRVSIHFVFASGDPGGAMLAEQGGSAVGRLEREGSLAIHTIVGPDHTFTPRWSHPLFVATILQALS